MSDLTPEDAANEQAAAWARRHIAAGTDATRYAWAAIAYRRADHEEALAENARRDEEAREAEAERAYLEAVDAPTRAASNSRAQYAAAVSAGVADHYLGKMQQWAAEIDADRDASGQQITDWINRHPLVRQAAEAADVAGCAREYTAALTRAHGVARAIDRRYEREQTAETAAMIKELRAAGVQVITLPSTYEIVS